MADIPFRWTKDMTLRLIEEYRKHRVLWDPRQKFYKLQFYRDIAWHKISEALGVRFQTCHSKLSTLLVTFRRECRKEFAAMGNPIRSTGVSHAYPQLLFLKKFEMQKILRQSWVLRPSTRNQKLNITKKGSKTCKKVIDDSIQIENDSATNMDCESALTLPEIDHTENHSQNVSILQLVEKIQIFDEVESFTEFVRVKMKNYSLTKIREIQHEICEILLKVESV